MAVFLHLLSLIISKKKYIQDNELHFIKYSYYKKFNIEVLITYYRETNMYDLLIYDLRDFTNQIIIEIKKEIFPSEYKCLYKAIDINSVIEEIKTIYTIKKANKKLTHEAQNRKMKSLVKKNQKDKNFYNTLNLVSTLLGIVEIIVNLDKKIPENKATLEETLENRKIILRYFFSPNLLINEKIIELKSLLFKIPLIYRNRSIFNLVCIKQHEALVACIYEILPQAIHKACIRGKLHEKSKE